MKKPGMAEGLMVAAGVCLAALAWAGPGFGKPLLTQELIGRAETDREARQQLLAAVLADVGEETPFGAEDVQSFRTSRGDLTGDAEPETVLVLEFGPRDTLAAAYQTGSDGQSLEYMGKVGDFYQIEQVEFLPIRALDREIVLLREYANQGLGAFEETRTVRGYAWDAEAGAFRQVLSLAPRIQATWNGLWDYDRDVVAQHQEAANPALTNRWERVVQEGDLYFYGGEGPLARETIALDMIQKYQVALDSPGDEVPGAASFQTLRERTLRETYVWNEGWSRFIVEEAVDNRTREPVAVLTDLANGPYTLVEGFAEQAAYVRALYRDGRIDTVERAALSRGQ